MDIKTELQNFKAIDLEDIAKNGAQIPDNIRNSVILYNKAIESLRSGSEDIAVIELKKATSMNSRFYEAMNLLGICYIYLSENEKAAEVFDRVVKAESNSILAMNYIQRFGLNESMPQPKGKSVKKTAEQAGEPLKRARTATEAAPSVKSKNRKINSAVMTVIGIAAGALVTAAAFKFIPGMEPNTYEQVQMPASTTQAVVQTEKNEELAELQRKFDLLQKDQESTLQQVDYYKAVIKLYDIEALYKGRKYENAADMLLLLKTVEFRDADKEKYDKLYAAVIPLAAKASFDQGYKLYNSRKYQESLKKLEKVPVYDPQFSRMDADLYYRGRCCQALQDSRSAIALFQKLMNEYPASNYSKSAKVRINELTKFP